MVAAEGGIDAVVDAALRAKREAKPGISDKSLVCVTKMDDGPVGNHQCGRVFGVWSQ